MQMGTSPIWTLVYVYMYVYMYVYIYKNIFKFIQKLEKNAKSLKADFYL